jgi:hypothetical protein
MNTENALERVEDSKSLVGQIADSLRHFVSQIPLSNEPRSAAPAERAKAIVLQASSKAALVSGTLALPAGPLGMMTILPDLFEIWSIQKQMVADLAAIYGKSSQLGEREMIYCLFRHAAGQAVRDLVVRAGGRFLVRSTTLGAMQRVLRRVGVSVTQRTASRAISRWVPVAGAIGIGGYAFYDTRQVGRTAMALFEHEIVREDQIAEGAHSPVSPNANERA